MRFEIGTRIGPYEILDTLGAGGMGEVYRAHDPRLDRTVAIKILRSHLAHDRDANTRFEREARAVAALSHPNVLTIFDVGTYDGAAYVVTEFLEGESLRARLDRSALPWRATAELGAAVADGVAAAHGRGIIHRDLKPENLFIPTDGRVKILDFGLAVSRSRFATDLTSDLPTLTQTGVLLGTVGYMAPEQIRGEPAQPASDIFALGCVLYEMCSGRRAFHRETAVQTLSAILETEPPTLGEVAQDVPVELDRLVGRCLEKHPSRRMASAHELSLALWALAGATHDSDPRKQEGQARSPRQRPATVSDGPSRKAESATSPHSTNAEAYQLYLRARYSLNTGFTDEQSTESIGLLRRAIELDPNFALARAELAKAYIDRQAFIVPSEAALMDQHAFAEVEQALALDPNLAEAYVARGDLLWTHAHRFAHERAAKEYRRALAINTNLDGAHQGLACIFVHLGFFEEGLRHAGLALELNPSNGQALHHKSEGLLWSGREREALSVIMEIPATVFAGIVEANKAYALFRSDRSREAWSRLRRAHQENPRDAMGALAAVEALFLADTDPEHARECILRATGKERYNLSHHTKYYMAAAWARMGRADEAVPLLREAAETGFPCAPLCRNDPDLNPIREDPEFQAHLGEVTRQAEQLRAALFPEAG